MTSLSDTCAPYNNGTVSVAGKYVLTDMEKVAARLQVVLNSEQDRKCAQYIMEVFCRWSMPACTNNTPTPLCRQSCEDVRKKCSDLWRKATDVMHPELTPWRSCLDLTDDNITCITVDTGRSNGTVITTTCLCTDGTGWAGLCVSGDVCARTLVNRFGSPPHSGTSSPIDRVTPLAFTAANVILLCLGSLGLTQDACLCMPCTCVCVRMCVGSSR